MKLNVLAMAVIAASVSVSAQANLEISGDIGMFWSDEGKTSLESYGAEVNVDASQKFGTLTFSAHAELELNSDSASAPEDDPLPTNVDGQGSVAVDDITVGVSGNFGSLTIGDTGSACDQLLTGGSAEMEFTHHSGGCLDSASDKFVYQRSAGSSSIAVSYAPDHDYTAVAVSGSVAGISAALAYEDEDGTDRVTVGLEKAFGPMTIGVRGNDADQLSVHGLYEVGNHSIYGGVADNDGVNPVSLGYTRKFGKTSVFAELHDEDTDADALYGVGISHAF